MVKGLRDVTFKVLLAESSCRRLALYLPFLPIRYEDSSSMKGAKNVTCECSAYVIFVIVLLNMLEVLRVVNDMQTEERDCHFISRPVALVERIPGIAAGSPISLQLFNVAFECFSFWSRDPCRVGRTRCPESSVPISPTEPCSEKSSILHLAAYCSAGNDLTCYRQEKNQPSIHDGRHYRHLQGYRWVTKQYIHIARFVSGQLWK